MSIKFINYTINRIWDLVCTQMYETKGSVLIDRAENAHIQEIISIPKKFESKDEGTPRHLKYG